MLNVDQFSSEAEPAYSWPARTAKIPPYAEWEDAHAAGAVDSVSSFIRLSIASSYDERVTLHKWAAVVDRQPPILGILAAEADTGGGGTPTRSIDIDLRTGNVLWRDSDGSLSAPPPLWVHNDDQETVDVTAHAVRCFCRWRIQVTYTVAGDEPKTITIGPPGGGWFETSSAERTAILTEKGCKPPPTDKNLCRRVSLDTTGLDNAPLGEDATDDQGPPS